MTQILFINLEFPQNKGDAARLIGLSILLRKFIPDAEQIKVSFYPDKDYETFKDYGIKLANISNSKSIFLRLFLRPVKCIAYNLTKRWLLKCEWLITDPLLKQYASADIIIDEGGDDFREEISFSGFFFGSYATFLGIIMGKKMIICSTSIGPFKTKIGKLFAKFLLNRMEIISVRERLSKNCLEHIGVKKSIQLIPDMGLFLPPAPNETINKILVNERISVGDGPLIGISANWVMVKILYLHKLENKSEDFITLMAKTADYLIENLTSSVIFIPHCVEPQDDDRLIAENIYKLTKNKDRIKLINTEYSPEEVKALIGQCDLFIGARMHSCIAAASMNVPFISIVYNERRAEVMKMFGFDEYICNVMTVTFDEMKTKIDDIWINKEAIKKKLKAKMERLSESALTNGELIKNLVETHKNIEYN